MLGQVYNLMKINDPDKDGDYLLVSEQDFNADIHTLFGEEPKKQRGRKPKEEVSE